MTTQIRGAQRQAVLTCTILNGATVSDAVQLGENMVLCGLIIPTAAWTSSTVSFQVSAVGVTFGALSTVTGAVLSATMAAGTHISLDPAVFAPWSFVKVVSTTAQGADRIVGLIVRTFA